MPGINEVAFKAATDTNERFIIQDDGKMIWGSGAAIGDIILARSAANTLALTGGLTTTVASTLAGNTTLTGTLTLSGGILTTTQAAVPTIPSPASGWGTISFSAASTDTAGVITFTVTGTPAANAAALPVVFNRTYAAAPKSVMLTLNTVQTTNPITLYYITAMTTTGFTIATNAAAAAQAGVQLGYQVAF